MAKHAVIAPFVNFSSLDVVGVVVPAGTHSDRKLITAGGR
jgi:rod shape-determining protein MreC